MRVTLTQTARRDIESAAEWYEQHREGLGLEFTDCVLDAIEGIAEHPLAYRKIVEDVRRCIIKRFPYALWYRVETEGNIVIACLHHKRNPKLAADRALDRNPKS